MSRRAPSTKLPRHVRNATIHHLFHAEGTPASESAMDSLRVHLEHLGATAGQRATALSALATMTSPHGPRSWPTFDDVDELALHRATHLIDHVRKAGGRVCFAPAAMLSVDDIQTLISARMRRHVVITIGHAGTDVCVREDHRGVGGGRNET